MESRADAIAYILKGYGRTSETFITNEIHLLETLGLKLSIFSFKRLVGEQEHAVGRAIKAPVHYLPEVPPRAGLSFFKWLRMITPAFVRSHLRLFRTRPAAYLRTFAEAMRLSFKYRAVRFRPGSGAIREFLQAGYIANQVLASGNVRRLHAHFCHTTTTVTMLVSQVTGIPFSFTAHAKDIYLRELNPGDLLQLKISRAKFVVTCTKANKDYLDRLNPAGTPIHAIYHGLDTSKFAPGKTADDDDGHSSMPLILSVGRLVEKKGFPYLVEACRRLKDKGYQFRCRIIGGAGSDSDRIGALIAELRLKDVITLGRAVTQEELIQIYRRATLFVLPCQILENGDRDGIPNVLVEAMAAETPVVSTNVSGIPELVEDGVTGLLTPQQDAAALAEAIEKLLDDSALRSRLGKAAREKVCRTFDARENSAALHQLFLAKSKRARSAP